ncbi:FHA domain-containing protein [Agromyces sp. MMS24-K17]|uniref:FHA domain-containing protein n=1 Tax=Agromyces sp. MMS24-K17 TaxID=3372850 RepID=UPI00375532BE
MVDGSVRIARGGGAPEWDVVVGRRFLAAIGAPAPGPSLEALAAAAADPDASLERLISCLPAPGGPGDDVAMAWWPDDGSSAGPVTVVARGDAVVLLTVAGDTTGARRRFAAEGIRPWHLAEFGDVESLRIHVVDAVVADGSGERVDALAAVHRATGVEWQAPSGPAHRHAEVDTRLVGHHLVTEPDGDRAAGSHGEAVMRFRIDDGPARDIRWRTVLGRRPLGLRAGDPDEELVVLPGADDSVSASHLELRAEGMRLVATDLRSTNGTVIERDGVVRRMRAGESVVVNPGTRLRLGADTIVEILPPRIVPRDVLDRQAPS